MVSLTAYNGGRPRKGGIKKSRKCSGSPNSENDVVRFRKACREANTQTTHFSHVKINVFGKNSSTSNLAILHLCTFKTPI